MSCWPAKHLPEMIPDMVGAKWCAAVTIMLHSGDRLERLKRRSESKVRGTVESRR